MVRVNRHDCCRLCRWPVRRVPTLAHGLLRANHPHAPLIGHARAGAPADLRVSRGRRGRFGRSLTRIRAGWGRCTVSWDRWFPRGLTRVRAGWGRRTVCWHRWCGSSHTRVRINRLLCDRRLGGFTHTTGHGCRRRRRVRGVFPDRRVPRFRFRGRLRSLCSRISSIRCRVGQLRLCRLFPVSSLLLRRIRILCGHRLRILSRLICRLLGSLQRV
mmetsp:Transcript_66085/g.159446  ORF Transcript_66085/g.159446 Transcript_66085/m.159446 type:complete len:215 (+) Transcript_66085:417-1061(+)